METAKGREITWLIGIFKLIITKSMGVQPQQDPGIPSGGWRRWIGKVKGERKRLDLPWFTQKANKAPDSELALFTEAAGALLVGWGRRMPSPWWRRRAPSWSGLRSPGKKVNSESPCVPSSHPERRTEREKERKGKKKWHRETKPDEQGQQLYF